uniref:Uncharacterized protein n=1 Tax=Strigamia maritima TaxID=126957 RepID=T1J833_STRMM
MFCSSFGFELLLAFPTSFCCFLSLRFLYFNFTLAAAFITIFKCRGSTFSAKWTVHLTYSCWRKKSYFSRTFGFFLRHYSHYSTTKLDAFVV